MRLDQFYDTHIYLRYLIEIFMGNLILPNIHIEKIELPLIFLAGPIRGAPNWQKSATEILFSRNLNLTIASPRKIEDSHYLFLTSEKTFERKRAWERHYLDIASKKGSILFWLPGEEFHECEKSYGAMTRLELGEWIAHYTHDHSVRFCVGSDGNFSKLGVIRYELKEDTNKKIANSLEETCNEAIAIAFQN